MSRKFEAKICWLSETQGGRKDIPLGDKYAPIIKLTKTQHKSNDFWSVFVFNKKKIIRFLNETRNLLFPGYFEKNNWLFQNYGKKKEKIIRRLFLKEISIDQQKADCFMRKLTHVKSMLEKDILATNIYTLAYEYDSKANLDYTTKIITE